MSEDLLNNRTKNCKIVRNILLLLYKARNKIKMTITATELKKNLGKYLEMAKNEEIIISKNGKEVARLTKPVSEKKAILKRLYGIAEGAENMNYRDERLSKI